MTGRRHVNALTAVLFGAAVCVCGPALAEVCDKVVNEAWQPADGPLVMFGRLLVTSIVIALAVSGTVLVGWLPWWVALVVGALAVLVGAISIADIYGDHTVIRGALQEGCRALWADLLGLLLGGLMLSVGRLRRPSPTASAGL